jgi:replicative superfamily II helicase
MYLYGAVDLLLLDEVHHLGEDRGSTLETVVVRMRILNQTLIESKTENSKIKRFCAMNFVMLVNIGIMISFPIVCFSVLINLYRMRIVALSATLPNLADIGDWIQCNSKVTILILIRTYFLSDTEL